MLATLRSKLLTGAVGVLFGLLGKLGDKAAINAAADSLSCQIYLLYRQLHRAAGAARIILHCRRRTAQRESRPPGASLAQAEYARAIRERAREKAEFPDLSHEAVNAAYPGRSQGFIQVLSTADGQLSHLNQTER